MNTKTKFLSFDLHSTTQTVEVPQGFVLKGVENGMLYGTCKQGEYESETTERFFRMAKKNEVVEAAFDETIEVVGAFVNKDEELITVYELKSFKQK